MLNLRLTALSTIKPPTLSPRSCPAQAGVGPKQEQSALLPHDWSVTLVRLPAPEVGMLQPMVGDQLIVLELGRTATALEGVLPRL